MKRIAIHLLVLFALVPAAPRWVTAAGLNLSWYDCGAAGLPSRTFACDSNEGYDVFVASIVAPDPAPAFDRLLIALSVRSAEAFPPWWEIATGAQCRVPLAATLSSAGVTGCPSYWTTGVVEWMPSTSRILEEGRVWVLQITGGPSQPWQPGEEVFLLQFHVLHDFTAGPKACAGCEIGMELRLDAVQLRLANVPVYEVAFPATRNAITWNGGMVPALPTSWGQIKALYR